MAETTLKIPLNCSSQDWYKLLTTDKIGLNIEPQLYDRLTRARKQYLKHATERKIYGYCTGLGELYEKTETQCPEDWEERVVEEHSAQTGEPVHPGMTRLFMIIRLNQLARLPAPIRPNVLEQLAKSIEAGLTPVIRSHGSVGASGDLSPTAQLVRCLYYGRGEAVLSGIGTVECGEGLRRAGLRPLPLERGEALFLLNNTAWSTTLCLSAATTLQVIQDRLVNLLARAVRLTSASAEHYTPELLAAKNCVEGKIIAEKLLGHASHSPRNLQSPYSIRCIPQILGAIARTLRISLQLLEEEACASTENPALINGRVLHGCNFHAIKPAISCSMIQVATAYLSGLIERVGAQLLRSKITGLPEHLAGEGSSVGAMIAHYTLAAISAHVKGLAGQELLYTTPTSGLQEDIVSMAPPMALNAMKQAENIAAMAGVLETIIERAEQLANGRHGPFTGLQDIIERNVNKWKKLVPWLSSPDELDNL